MATRIVDFAPGGHAKPRGQATAQHCLAEHPHTSTYIQTPTFGSREKQAHKSVTEWVHHAGRWRAKGTDDADHVSSPRN
jgi:hypothetical protein